MSVVSRPVTREHGSQHEAIIDAAIESGLLSISDSVTWELREGYLKARLVVTHPDLRGFKLELLQNPRLPRFSFQLMHNGRTAVRLCSNTPHDSAPDCPGGRVTTVGAHLHRWSDTTGDECTEPIPEPLGLIEEAFYGFLDRLGVQFVGAWADPPSVQFPFEAFP